MGIYRDTTDFIMNVYSNFNKKTTLGYQLIRKLDIY